MGGLTLLGHRIELDGYGYATIQVGQALQRLDASVRLVDMCPKPGEMADGEAEWRMEGTAVAMCTPDWLPHIHAERLAAFTMFEATKPPALWVENLNDYADLLLTPSEWCAAMFRENGVRTPIRVARWGVNTADYWLMERDIADRQRPYRFLWSGTADLRKGWDVAYRAFALAFGRSRDVELHLHFRDPLPANPRFADRNVRVTIGRLGRSVLRAMLQEADCFVFPSRGEGWGLPPREAAATGLPAIATDWSGLSEELLFWGMALGTKGTSRAEFGWYDYIGEWAEPDVEHLIHLMRWCAEHPDESARIGRNAAEWTAQFAQWSRTAQAVMEAL